MTMVALLLSTLLLCSARPDFPPARACARLAVPRPLNGRRRGRGGGRGCR